MMNFTYYLAAFAVVLGVLIIAHEFGHFLVARLTGVKVLRFSIGFGPSIWSKSFGHDATEWSIGIFPLGGYVKMLDEREGEVLPEERHRSFNRQSVWRRMAIVAAGPVANLLLAVLVYWCVFFQGSEEFKPVLATPVAESAAARAGLVNGERVLKVGGTSVQTWQDFRWELLRQAVDQENVVLEVINPRNEIALRHLGVSAARDNGWQGDALEKLGLCLYRPRIPAVIGKITSGSVAEMAGLLPGDEILRIDDTSIDSWHEVVRIVRGSPGRKLDIEVKRRGENRRFGITPEPIVEDKQEIGRIGASVNMSGSSKEDLRITIRYGLIPALGKAINETWDQSVFSLVMIGKMFSGEVSWRNISGPVTIADYAGQSARMGAGYYLKFMALVSISLAVLNLLPVPILDGGHLLYYVVEIVRRKPLSERCMEIGQNIGLALLLMLIACSLFNDVNRLLTG